MYYDLHIPWTSQVAEVEKALIFLAELGYSVVALTHTMSGKLPADLTCPIPAKLPFVVPSTLRIVRRCNLIFSDPAQNYRLQALAANYDILALRPIGSRALQQACQSLECDLISIDLTQRQEEHFKMKMVSSAIERGIRFEICYGPAISTTDANARRTLISNATQLIRATRGRGIIISSEARRSSSCRGPADVINLAAVWGLGQERGKEALEKLARGVVVSAQMKRTSFRGVIDVLYAGEKPVVSAKATIEAQAGGGGNNKRKADDQDLNSSGPAGMLEPKISKRQLKKQKQALRESQNGNSGTPSDIGQDDTVTKVLENQQ